MPAPRFKAERFAKGQRVRVYMGKGEGWMRGVVAEVDVVEQLRRTSVPYLVRLDPPSQRIASVLRDTSLYIRPEVGTPSPPPARACAQIIEKKRTLLVQARSSILQAMIKYKVLHTLGSIPSC